MAWAKLHTDILGDPKLMRAARKGLRGVEYLPWLIAFAKGADDEGRLSVAGEPAEAADIAELVPCATRKNITDCLKSLEKIGVLLRDSDGFLAFSQWDRRSGTKPSDAKSAISDRVSRFRAKVRETQVTVIPADSSEPPPQVTPERNALQGVTSNATEEEENKNKSKTQSAARETSPLFVLAWSVFPKRVGSNPRNTAEKAWRARVREGVVESDMFAGTEAYRAFCEAKGSVGTEFVMQGSRFFGPNREYANDWTPPKGAAAIDPSEPLVIDGVLTAYGERLTRPANV